MLYNVAGPEGRPSRGSRSERRLAGWTGLEPETSLFSKLVMARDFWLKRLNHRWLRRSVSFPAVHPNPRDSTRVVETFWRRRQHVLTRAPIYRSQSAASSEQSLLKKARVKAIDRVQRGLADVKAVARNQRGHERYRVLTRFVRIRVASTPWTIRYLICFSEL